MPIPRTAAKMSAAVDAVFGANEELRSRVAAASRSQELTTLFNDIADYILTLNPSFKSTSSKKRSHDEDNSSGVKKIKTEDDVTTPRKGSTSIAWTTDGETSFEAADISFAVPIRKKLRLELVGTAEDGTDGGIRGINPATGQFEVGMSYSDIDQVILVPVPEKPTPQFNFILIPHTSSTSEPIIFTVPSKRPKDVSFREPIENDTYELYIERAINSALASTTTQVIAPSSDEFESKSQQGRRKGERLWHVKAHRGSKEGFLYFLETGILWGFKKPVVFLGFDKVRSMSYTSVLQRTFNMVVTADVGGSGEEEIEFGMIDQVDFEGIDGYVKRHGLNDASLAESRKARKYNVNAPLARGDIGEVGAEGGGDGGGGNMDPEELEKALQDAEDEEEEDYEVSGGESEGSGSDSEEEDDDDGGGGGDDEGEEEEAEDYSGEEEDS